MACLRVSTVGLLVDIEHQSYVWQIVYYNHGLEKIIQAKCVRCPLALQAENIGQY